uniref:Potassium channel domain-containing protein n=1 Tax=Meloidogyne incognita TaxID=6306 RepID=A0A914M1F2_MELIC
MRRMERYLRKNYCQRKQRNRIFDGLGRFLKGEMLIKLFGCKRKESSINSGEDEDEETISLNPWFYEDEELENEYEAKQISPFTLAAIVFTYLAAGAILLPLLQGCFQFIDGLFYSYLCFTAIEYGHLIPENNSLIPIVLLYMCIGLVLSTIALDVGSNYVRSLYYLGKQATSIAHTSFFYGSKTVTVKDLISAVGQAIGMSPESMEKVDMNRMVGDAIAVKEGQLDKVGQNYMFLEGIWPPELIPLFQRDGDFPSWVDADELKRLSLRPPTSNGIGLIQKREELAPILSLSTYSNGQLHRSLHSTSSNSQNSKEKRNNKKKMGEKKRETTQTVYSNTDKNNNNGNNNCKISAKDMSNIIPFI